MIPEANETNKVIENRNVCINALKENAHQTNKRTYERASERMNVSFIRDDDDNNDNEEREEHEMRKTFETVK